MIKAEWTNDDTLSTGQTTQTNDSNVLNAMDCVSRQAAIDEIDVCAELLRRVLDDANIVGAEREKYRWGLGLIESCIFDMKELQSVHPIPKWIPVTERLPEKDGMYLVSISPSSRLEKRVDTDFYSHFGIWQIYGKFVTAWIPLPEPYRKEAEDVH